MDGKYMELVRAIVRPLITASGWGVLLGLLVAERPVPEWFQVAIIGLTTWWFATRVTSEAKK